MSIIIDIKYGKNTYETDVEVSRNVKEIEKIP